MFIQTEMVKRTLTMTMGMEPSMYKERKFMRVKFGGVRLSILIDEKTKL